MQTLIKAVLVSLIFIVSPAFAQSDAIRGKQLYATHCAVCHSMDYNGTGPAHRGVYGRRAGSLEHYNYSAAMKSSRIIWTEKTLDAWIANPEKLIPGQKMGFALLNARDRADMIAYLKTESINSTP